MKIAVMYIKGLQGACSIGGHVGWTELASFTKSPKTLKFDKYSDVLTSTLANWYSGRLQIDEVVFELIEHSDGKAFKRIRYKNAIIDSLEMHGHESILTERYILSYVSESVELDLGEPPSKPKKK